MSISGIDQGAIDSDDEPGTRSRSTSIVCSCAQVHHEERWIAAKNERPLDQGLITVMNHTSALDDPVSVMRLIGIRSLLRPFSVRWTLGAQDKMFTNPVSRFVFRNLKVVPVARAGGLEQPV